MSVPSTSARRLAVLMFTDVVDSTAQRQRLGERRAEELRVSVDALQTDLFEANGGRLVKHLGDGMMAAFDSATGALRCAIGIQVELERMRLRLPEPVLLRIGVAAGDVTEDGGDLFGMPVVQAARLCDAADDGGVLVADLVRELTGRDPDIDFRGPEAMSLKGLDEPTFVWHLGWDLDLDATGELPTGLHRDDRFRFVGRSSEWDVLADAWARAGSGELQVATVSGEAGVGKTRLVAEFADWVHRDGGTVLFGSNDENLDVPYQPFAEILRQFVDRQPDWAISRRLGRDRAELVKLLPDLAAHLDEFETRAESDPQTERFRMFEAVSRWLSETAAVERLMIVIDDLHWASESTLQLLRHIAVGREAPPVLIVATQRPTAAAGAPMPSLPVPPRRSHHLSLSSFDPQTVLDFIEAAAGHSLDEIGSPLAERIHAQTGGNAFFCRELALHLVDSGVLVQEDGRWSLTVAIEDVGIPDSIRRVVDERLTRVPDDARKTLQWAAVIGQEVDVSLLTQLVDSTEDSVLDALEICVDARLLEERGHDRFFFPHALVRASLRDAISRTRRRSMHRRIAAELMAQRERGIRVPIGELARHFELGATDDQLLQAAALCEEAGVQATEQLAHEAAVEHYERAVELLDRSPDGAVDLVKRSDLLIELAASAGRAADPRAAELAQSAVEAAERSDDPMQLARALLASSRGAASMTGAVNPDRVQRLEEVSERLPRVDHPVRARLLAVLATELQFTGRDERVVELSDQALAMARRLDHAETLVFVLVERLGSLRVQNRLDGQLADAVELVRRSKQIGDKRAEFFAEYRSCDIYLALTELDRFRASQESVVLLASELKQPSNHVRSLRVQYDLAWLRGDLDRAEELLEAMLEMARDINQERQYIASYLGARAKIGGARGRPEIAVDGFSQLASFPMGTDGFQAGLAVAHHLAGDEEQARELYEQLIHKGVERLSHDVTRVHTLAFMASLCASLKDVSRVDVIESNLLPFEDLWVISGAGSYGPVAHFRARLAALAGRDEEAAAGFADASRRCQAMEAPLLEAWNEIEWADFLIDRGSVGTAGELAHSALSTGRRHRAGGIESAAQELIDRIASSSSVPTP